jgi:hypothetical protein
MKNNEKFRKKIASELKAAKGDKQKLQSLVKKAFDYYMPLTKAQIGRMRDLLLSVQAERLKINTNYRELADLLDEITAAYPGDLGELTDKRINQNQQELEYCMAALNAIFKTGGNHENQACKKQVE